MDLRMLRDEDYVEAIKEGEIVKLPESVAREEDLFILRRLVKPENFVSAERIPKKIDAGGVKSYSKLEEWKSAKGNLKKNNVIKDLVDNFHWEIARARRLKGISRKQLADKCGVSEENIKTVELGDLPRDDFVLINKIESILGIDLRREKKPEGVNLNELQKMKEDKVREEIEKVHKKDISKTEFQGRDIEIIGFD